MNKRKLIEQCELTLKQNDLGSWTRPAPGLYPHQWLWDSCFVAIGLRHIDIKRAQSEIDSLFRGQWKNGMIPHIIHSENDYYAQRLWDHSKAPDMPDRYLTSGVTQPPMIAEAIVRIGEVLSKKDRASWFRKHFNQLLAHHEWLYRERDLQKTGLIILVHPWESGVDNSPAWMHLVHHDGSPLWIKIAKTFRLTNLMENRRQDTRYVPANERIQTLDALLLFYQARRLRRFHYDSNKMIHHSSIAMVDVLFNSILIRANSLLKEIADEIDAEIPSWLLERFRLAEKSLDDLWDAKQKSFLDQPVSLKKHTSIATIGRYLPLYSGAISQKRADHLAKCIKNELESTLYPIASTPTDSPYFGHHRYWQGPTWVNTNWLICDGLERYGYSDVAAEIKHRTLQLIDVYGPHEYFSPIDGTPAGAHQFSWTAALAIDMAYSST